MDTRQYENYLSIMQEELIPAMGCTEPIAVALAAAKAREVLGAMPVHMVCRCSGNIVKNVKGVVVPNSGGQKGIAPAAILGVVGGDASKGLEVIAGAGEDAIAKTRELVDAGFCQCELAEGVENLYVRAEVANDTDTAVVEIRTNHDHVSLIEKNGEVLFTQPDVAMSRKGDKSKLNFEDIYTFANTVNLDAIKPVLRNQLNYNSAISHEGLVHDWGACVGKTLAAMGGGDIRMEARAAAAAGSDARMNGCSLPVVITSGSGNQGITCTMPLVVYAKHLGVTEEKLYRALALTDLLALYQKYYVGNLSAYCGAVSAGAAAGCGIAYLNDADLDTIKRTMINALGDVGGIVCDGAKASCAAKISSAVDAGILGYEMARQGRVFPFGEGLVDTDADQTVRNYGRVGKKGMASTDIEILNIMLGK
ncbi:MAG: L-serine ammonia-lyase, iron-sulfur-dependent, subunit alpha [Megasphaera sp.]|nr:L-serine ammonia-lyase, iron-sulfur-dependent, subunit alpha [Megasphaera sp.]MCH4188130.1 L-serine ammonia-lyase, iron-sulfur-dependent, subunit alpha [Megasphaera sp.]MCH4217968.1 L-serine ammonia-lyase, iron-sulfur-dependent, subunit alpha [Megasphaera sp.]